LGRIPSTSGTLMSLGFFFTNGFCLIENRFPLCIISTHTVMLKLSKKCEKMLFNLLYLIKQMHYWHKHVCFHHMTNNDLCLLEMVDQTKMYIKKWTLSQRQ